MVLPENIKAKFGFLTKLTRSQKLSLLTFLFILFVLPLSLIAALNPVIFNQKAQTVMTPPEITSTPTPSNYSWARCTNSSAYCDAFCQSQGKYCGNVCEGNGSYGYGMNQTEVGYPTQFGTCTQEASPLGGYYTGQKLSLYCNSSYNVYCCCGSGPVVPSLTPTPTQNLGLIINPEIVKVQGEGGQLVKMFDMMATISSNYLISAILVGNPNAVVTISPTSGYIGVGFTQAVSIKVPSGYVNTKYNYEVTVKANNVSKKIPVEVTIIAPTPIPTATPTPTKIPTPTPTPTKAPVPTFMPTPLPTPVPVVNQNPFIQTTSLPTAKWLNDYKASVIGYDKDMNDTLTMQITGLPFGLIQAPCTFSKLVDRVQIACTIYGRSYGFGNYKINVTLRDNKGGAATSILNLTVSSPLPRLSLPWTLKR